MTLADPGKVAENQRRPLSPDARRLVAAPALRAFTYGFAALLLGTTLRRSPGQAGLVLDAVVAGTIAASLAVARWSDRLGRRRCYATLYALLSCRLWCEPRPPAASQAGGASCRQVGGTGPNSAFRDRHTVRPTRPGAT